MSEVFKFGGSTIKNAQAFVDICNIISCSKDVSFIVVSATFNTTNELEEIAKSTLQSKCNALDLASTLIYKHEKLSEELNIHNFCENFFLEIKSELNSYIQLIHDQNNCSAQIMDSVYSLGERLCSFMIATYLQEIMKDDCMHLDAREIITTNNDYGEATPLFGFIEKNIQDFNTTRFNKKVVTQGFIGRSLSGQTTTLGREGSDYTSSIIAWATHASKLVIWKDVGEIKSWDPKFRTNAHTIDFLSYSEANSLTEAGAKVLFHRTMYPLQELKIPLEIRGIKNPNHLGTKISDKACNKLFALVELKKGEDKVSLSICGSSLLTNPKVFEVISIISGDLENFQIEVFKNNLITITSSLQKRNSLIEYLIELVDQSFH